jgi:hypothetical protein
MGVIDNVGDISKIKSQISKTHPKDKRYRIPAPPIKLPSSFPSINSGQALLKRETGKGETIPHPEILHYPSMWFGKLRVKMTEESIKLTSIRVADNMKVRSKHDE